MAWRELGIPSGLLNSESFPAKRVKFSVNRHKPPQFVSTAIMLWFEVVDAAEGGESNDLPSIPGRCGLCEWLEQRRYRGVRAVSETLIRTRTEITDMRAAGSLRRRTSSS